ncbi:MAG: RusA family crossover junction endodeoxyribonuclease, partial [Verrucomicrobia bacterium]|nr:RusA family crossover junction endodeoxyribonuclease [Verrucomicrobiota bacterium]
MGAPRQHRRTHRLPPWQVEAIRVAVRGGAMMKAVARHHRVSLSCVSRVCSGSRHFTETKMQHHPPEIIVAFGHPAGQGSKRLARVRGKQGDDKSIMLETSAHLKPWRAAVTAAAMQACAKYRERFVAMDIVVRWPRPASHFTGRGALRSGAPDYPGYVDGDKLARAIFDALKGVCYRDDRQVARHSVL